MNTLLSNKTLSNENSYKTNMFLLFLIIISIFSIYFLINHYNCCCSYCCDKRCYNKKKSYIRI